MNQLDNAITVVIACHSDQRWTSIIDACTSVQKQHLLPAEIIVTVDHNAALATRLRRHCSGITVVENDGGTRGASANRNAGVAAVLTPLVAFLDDDEVAEPDWLEKLVEPLQHSNVVGTGGRYVPAWEAGEPSWFPAVFAWAVGAHYEGMPEITAPVRNVWAGNMAIRTEAFRAVGGFRTDFGKVGDRSQPEDTDLCIRAAAASGGMWMYVPAAVIHHEVPARRSSFRFFLARCYSEGAGKVVLQRGAAAGTLSDESDYLRTVVPASVRRDLRQGVSAFGRLGATVAGVVAAGLGAAVTTVRVRRS